MVFQEHYNMHVKFHAEIPWCCYDLGLKAGFYYAPEVQVKPANTDPDDRPSETFNTPQGQAWTKKDEMCNQGHWKKVKEQTHGANQPQMFQIT